MPAALIQHREAAAGLVRGLEMLERLVRRGRVVWPFNRRAVVPVGLHQRHDLAVLAMVVGGEVVNRPVEPRPGLAHGVELGMEPEERLLHEVLRGFGLLDELHRVSEQGRFEGGKELRQGFR